MEGIRYQARGFYPVNEPPAVRRIIAATVVIVKGDVLHDNTNGLATNATTALDAIRILGIAAEDCDNSAASATKQVAYYPIDAKTQYRVPVEENAAITAAARGTNVDLEAVGNIDISDIVGAGMSFGIDAIDITALAIAANTFGYAIGHFKNITISA